MTNVVLTPNQTRTTCPEDPTELPKIICGRKNATSGEVNITEGVCVKGQVGSLLKSHGESTGNCILSDRMPNTYVCEIKGSDVSGFEKPSERTLRFLGSSLARTRILYFKCPRAQGGLHDFQFGRMGLTNFQNLATLIPLNEFSKICFYH